MEFERAWQLETPPTIHQWLEGTAGIYRESLVRELLLLDIDYREMDGLRLSREEYSKLLPEDRSTVDLIFDNSHSGLPAHDTITYSSKADTKEFMPMQIGRYHIVREAR